MFDDDYLNKLNYDNHFLNNNFNNNEYQENKEEINYNQNDSTDNVINNSKQIMDKFLYNLTKNDNDKDYQDFLNNKGNKQNKNYNNMINNYNMNKRKKQQQMNNDYFNMNNQIEYGMNKYNSPNLNLVNTYDDIINENNNINNINSIPYSKPIKYTKKKNMNNYFTYKNNMLNYSPIPNLSNNNHMNNNVNDELDDDDENEYDFNFNINFNNNLNQGRNNFSKNKKKPFINNEKNKVIRNKISDNNKINKDKEFKYLTDFSEDYNNNKINQFTEIYK